jgi:hypothetical protein
MPFSMWKNSAEPYGAAGHLGVIQAGSHVPGVQQVHHIEAAHGLDEPGDSLLNRSAPTT